MPHSKSADGEPTPGAAKPSPPMHPEVREGFIAVGAVLTSFGLHGDIKVEPLTDFPERFAAGKRVWLDGSKRRIERTRWQRGVVFLKLGGIDTPEQIAHLRGHYLELEEAFRAALNTDEYYQSDILGLRVITTAGEDLGTVFEFLPTGANDVLVVRGARGEVLIPMIDDVVRAVDLRTGSVTIEAIAGLLPDAAAAAVRAGLPPRRWRPRKPKDAFAPDQSSP